MAGRAAVHGDALVHNAVNLDGRARNLSPEPNPAHPAAPDLRAKPEQSFGPQKLGGVDHLGHQIALDAAAQTRGHIVSNKDAAGFPDLWRHRGLSKQ